MSPCRTALQQSGVGTIEKRGLLAQGLP